MDEKYFAKKVESKWQKKWSESGAFQSEIDDSRPKFYQLEMLPYPSGNLHMGHVRNYSVGDAVAWYKRLKGFNVLHPIGWDSFGQPAEDAAVKRGVNPRQWTEENISVMRGQLERLGFSYDWRRQIAAHRPDYYKFDQWFFLKMYERGLAYKRMTAVNWCEHDKATLSNEQASGGLCWRCGNPVTKKDLEQWFFKTTAYADRLLDDASQIEAGWPASVMKRQRDWIGRSTGAFIDFRVSDRTAVPLSQDGDTAGEASTRLLAADIIRVFTTRVDTIYGANAIVVAADHPTIAKYSSTFSDEVRAKIGEIRRDHLRPADRENEPEKDGIDTGLAAINPFSGEIIPVWIGNYVMMEYGTGAVMSVPAHDERDFEFARKFGLAILRVISPAKSPSGITSSENLAAGDRARADEAQTVDQAFTEYGILVNSGEWSGKSSDDAKREMTAFAAKNGFGESATTYRLRDWGISRQRFWGAPIPILYCDVCGIVPERFENLPVRLPENAPITGTGESPLAKVAEFYNASCPSCGGGARRETDTMDTFVDSSWYFFRYLDPKNEEMPFDPRQATYWTPVDQYIGGDDHAVMHLIYTRFWNKVMKDLGLVGFDEPIKRLLTQGMVVGETFFDDSTGKREYFPPEQVTVERDAKGKIVSARIADGRELRHAIERMSKSKGNGVDPDEMIDIYGADAARLFVLFAAPVENELVWHESGIEGAVRFLQRVWRFVWKWRDVLQRPDVAGTGETSTRSSSDSDRSSATTSAARKLRMKTHQTIKRVDDSLFSLQFNTPVAALMELANAVYEIKVEPDGATPDEVEAVREAVTALVLMITPFAPHAAEELYAYIVGNDDGILANGALFPEYLEEFAKADEIEIPIQVNGKLRSRIFASPSADQETLRSMALADEKIMEYTSGKEIVKVVVVPNRLVSVVVKG